VQTLTLWAHYNRRETDHYTIVQQYGDWYTLAVDGKADTFGTREEVVPSSLYQM